MAGSLLERGRVTENPQCHGVHAAEFKIASGFYDDVATLSAHTHTYTCIQYTFNLCIHIGVHTCIDHTCYMRMHIQIYTMTFMQKKHIYYTYINIYVENMPLACLCSHPGLMGSIVCCSFVSLGARLALVFPSHRFPEWQALYQQGGVLNPMPFLGLEGALGVMSWYNFGDK